MYIRNMQATLNSADNLYLGVCKRDSDGFKKTKNNNDWPSHLSR